MKNQFQIVLTQTTQGCKHEKLLGYLPPKHEDSISLTRDCLMKHACKEFGAEMKDFRVIPVEGKMIKFYAQSNRGDTITIEYPGFMNR